MRVDIAAVPKAKGELTRRVLVRVFSRKVILGAHTPPNRNLTEPTSVRQHAVEIMDCIVLLERAVAVYFMGNARGLVIHEQLLDYSSWSTR